VTPTIFHSRFPQNVAVEVIFVIHLFLGHEINWIGLTRDPANDSVWWWNTGEVMDQTNGGQHWLPGYPKHDFMDCAYMDYEQGSYGFRERNCTRLRKYFCIKDIEN